MKVGCWVVLQVVLMADKTASQLVDISAAELAVTLDSYLVDGSV